MNAQPVKVVKNKQTLENIQKETEKLRDLAQRYKSAGNPREAYEISQEMARVARTINCDSSRVE